MEEYVNWGSTVLYQILLIIFSTFLGCSTIDHLWSFTSWIITICLLLVIVALSRLRSKAHRKFERYSSWSLFSAIFFYCAKMMGGFACVDCALYPDFGLLFPPGIDTHTYTRRGVPAAESSPARFSQRHARHRSHPARSGQRPLHVHGGEPGRQAGLQGRPDQRLRWDISRLYYTIHQPFFQHPLLPSTRPR